jgi:hypothetical protein
MSTIKTETLSTPSNSTVPVDTVVNGTAKAWVNFNGTGTVAIRRAFNVSSITDVGAGSYEINFTNAMPDNDYSAIATSANVTNGAFILVDGDAVRTTSRVDVDTRNSAFSQGDCSDVNVAIFS